MIKYLNIQNAIAIIALPGFLIFAFLHNGCISLENEESISRKWENIKYAGDDNMGHLLDIYLPRKANAPYPVIMTVAGSAFFSDSSKHWAFGLGKPLLAHGFAIVAVNHRSSRKARFPAQINDIKGAVRFIRANAETYSLDTAFIGITGNSSGGHLSAMMGTSGGVNTYKVGQTLLSIEGRVGGNLVESSAVDAVVDWYGPTAFQKMDSCGSELKHDDSDSPESILIGGPIQEHDDLCMLANPITYIDEKDPPFLIIHGDADPLVPPCQSVFLHEALIRHGVKSELIIIPGGGHGGKGVWEDNYIDRMIRFFIKVKEDKVTKKVI
jgi:acetyl esterase/lipase